MLTAAGVGGGSLVYANVQLRAPADVFDDPAGRRRSTAPTLDPWYDRTEEALQPRDDARRSRRSTRSAPSPRRGAAPARAEPLPLAVHFGEAARHPFSGVFQQGCDNLGRCDIGCPMLAKNTVDITYIARAEAHGAEVYRCTRCRASTAARRRRRWRVGFQRPRRRDDGHVEAPVLVLAAGTVGSPPAAKQPAAPRRALAGAGDPLLRQRRRARAGPRPRSGGRRRRAHRVRAVDDEPARLHGRPRLHGRRRRPPGELRRPARDRPRLQRADRVGARRSSTSRAPRRGSV